jgi:hypothetical protein
VIVDHSRIYVDLHPCQPAISISRPRADVKRCTRGGMFFKDKHVSGASSFRTD